MNSQSTYADFTLELLDRLYERTRGLEVAIKEGQDDVHNESSEVAFEHWKKAGYGL